MGDPSLTVFGMRPKGFCGAAVRLVTSGLMGEIPVFSRWRSGRRVLEGKLGMICAQKALARLTASPRCGSRAWTQSPKRMGAAAGTGGAQVERDEGNNCRDGATEMRNRG